MINNQKTFSKRAALSFAFEALRDYFIFFLFFALILFGLYSLFGLYEFSSEMKAILAKIPQAFSLKKSSICSYVSYIFLLPGICNIALKIYDRNEFTFADIFSNFSVIGKNLLVWLLFLISVLIFAASAYIFAGIASFIILLLGTKQGFLLDSGVLGVIWVLISFYPSLKISLYLFAIIDKSLSSIQALKYSWRMTKNNMINIIILFLFLHTLPSIFLFLIRLFVMGKWISIGIGTVFMSIYYILYAFTFMLEILVLAYIYRQLEPAKEV